MTQPPDPPLSSETPLPHVVVPPLHLTTADFETYLPERATSNAFTRPRLELKQRMLAWGRAVAGRLAELGISLEITGSDEHPNLRNGRRVDCQRVFFWRDAEARAQLEQLIDRKRSLAARLGDPAPHKDHAYLALMLDSARVEVSIEIHPEAWVDAGNVRARLADPEAALELMAAIEALPEQFELGVGADTRTQAQRARSEDVRALLDESAQTKRPLWIGWSVPRDVALTHSELLDEQLGDAIVALGPVFKLVAWAPDNDMLVLDREWRAAREEQAKLHEEAERERAEWEARREGERQSRPRPPESVQAIPATRRVVRRDDDELGRSRTRLGRHAQNHPQAHGRTQEHTEESAPSLASDTAFLRTPRPKPGRIPRRVRPAETDANVPIEKGSRVEVLEGPFVGKVGVVQELDGRGNARVLLGLLAIRLEVKDLVASVEGRERPLLASSHRKPLPSR